MTKIDPRRNRKHDKIKTRKRFLARAVTWGKRLEAVTPNIITTTKPWTDWKLIFLRFGYLAQKPPDDITWRKFLIVILTNCWKLNADKWETEKLLGNMV